MRIFQYARDYINTIFETDAYPYARALRTGFYDKLVDAFWFFRAVCEYATLGLLAFLRKACHWGNRPKIGPALILCVAYIPYALLFTACWLSSLFITIAVSPIILFAEIIIRWKTRSLLKKVNNLLTSDNMIHDHGSDDFEPSWPYFDNPDELLQNRIYKRNQDMSIHCHGTHKKLVLEFRNCNQPLNTEPFRPTPAGNTYTDVKKEEPWNRISLDLENNSNDRETLDALLRLNMWGITQNLENTLRQSNMTIHGFFHPERRNALKSHTPLPDDLLNLVCNYDAPLEINTRRLSK